MPLELFTQLAVVEVPPDNVDQFATEVLQVPLGVEPELEPADEPFTSHHLAAATFGPANPESGREKAMTTVKSLTIRPSRRNLTIRWN